MLRYKILYTFNDKNFRYTCTLTNKLIIIIYIMSRRIHGEILKINKICMIMVKNIKQVQNGYLFFLFFFWHVTNLQEFFPPLKHPPLFWLLDSVIFLPNLVFLISLGPVLFRLSIDSLGGLLVWPSHHVPKPFDSLYFDKVDYSQNSC